ncbi:hypothetical protein OOT33_01570 [Sphingobium sp. DEHP117]|uniref:hypothetical protein n=1 Tax=Sphingobium sp. DEHP117 TaxID=2993436 RepID=UPI0027D69247|nr:hypothetical protein [Sphingobium sp. DEHP117]MDQ4419132.1 hypothetical protein [Sphingobium sp. DEHP117]
MQQVAYRAENPDLPDIDLHALRQRAHMIAAIAATLNSHPLARGGGELCEHVRRDQLLAHIAERGGDALRIGLGLIARRLERRDALF